MSDKERIKSSLATMSYMSATLARMEAEYYDEMEAKREYWKAEEEKKKREYRKSKEYRDLRAKKKANKKLRKKSQGR